MASLGKNHVFLGLSFGILLLTSLSCAGLVEGIDKAARKKILEEKAAPTLSGLAGSLDLVFNSPNTLKIISETLFGPPPTGAAPAFPFASPRFNALAEVTGFTLDVTCDNGGTLRLTLGESSVTDGTQRTIGIEAQNCRDNIKDGFLQPISDPPSTVPDIFVTLNGTLNFTGVFPAGTTDDGGPSEFTLIAPSFDFALESPTSSTELHFKAFNLTGKFSFAGATVTLNGTYSYKNTHQGATTGAEVVFTQFVLTRKEISPSKAELTINGKLVARPLASTSTAQCTIGAYEIKTLTPLIIDTSKDTCPESGKIEVEGASEDLHAIYIFSGPTITVQDPHRPDIETQITCDQLESNLHQCGLGE